MLIVADTLRIRSEANDHYQLNVNYTIIMARSSKWQLHDHSYQVIFPVNGVKKPALYIAIYLAS